MFTIKYKISHLDSKFEKKISVEMTKFVFTV